MVQVSIQKTPPAQAVFGPIKSASAHVLGRQLIEVRPEANVNYSYSTNSEIIFHINSNAQFIDFQNSYLRFQLRCSGNNNGSATLAKYLSEGGGHSLFKNIVLESSSGVLLQRLDGYNRLYAIMSNMTHSAEYVKNSLWREGDSLLPAMVQTPSLASYKLINVPSTTQGAYDIVTRIVTYSVTAIPDLLLNVNVGDFVELTFTNGLAIVSGVVKAITATSITLEAGTDQGQTNINVGAAASNQIKVWPQSYRQTMANNEDAVCCVQLQIPLLQNGDYFPLFLMRGGLTLRLQLEDPIMCLVAGGRSITLGYSGFDVSIRNPVYVCDMITPDQGLSDIYLQAYKTTGINYSYLGYRKFLNVQSTASSTGEFSFQMNPAVRSAKHMILQIQDSRANTTAETAGVSYSSPYTCDAMAQGLSTNIKELQVAVGSSRFPISRPLPLLNALYSELEMEAERALRQAGSLVYGKRASSENQSGTLSVLQTGFVANTPSNVPRRLNQNYEGNSIGGPIRLFPIVELSRHSTPFSGLDCSLSPVQVTVNRDTAYNVGNDTAGNVATSAYFHCWVAHDQVLQLSSAGTIVYS